MSVTFMLKEYLITFGWALVGTFSMAIGFAVMTKIINKITPFNEWEEIKNGNIAVAIMIGSVMISAALVIAKAIS